MKQIIAVVGMCGAGKSVLCDYLENIDYKKVYFGGVTMDKLKEKGLEITPENEKMMREGLRKELGMGAYAIVLLPKIKELAKNNNVVLDGLYSWDEVKILKEEFKDTTIIMIVQKISSCREVDRVLVIDDGTVVGNGSHSDLIENNTIYKEISESQKEVMP